MCPVSVKTLLRRHSIHATSTLCAGGRSAGNEFRRPLPRVETHRFTRRPRGVEGGGATWNRGVEPGPNRTWAQPHAGRGYQRAGPGGAWSATRLLAAAEPLLENGGSRGPTGGVRSRGPTGALHYTRMPMATRSWLLDSTVCSPSPFISGLLFEGNERLQLSQL